MASTLGLLFNAYFTFPSYLPYSPTREAAAVHSNEGERCCFSKHWSPQQCEWLSIEDATPRPSFKRIVKWVSFSQTGSPGKDSFYCLPVLHIINWKDHNGIAPEILLPIIVWCPVYKDFLTSWNCSRRYFAQTLNFPFCKRGIPSAPTPSSNTLTHTHTGVRARACTLRVSVRRYCSPWI